MALLLKAVSPEEAVGDMKAMYDKMLKKIGMIPKPFQLYSVSPHMQNALMHSIRYFSRHPNIEFPVFTLIRLLSAERCNYEYCKKFNIRILKKMGMTEDELEEVIEDPSKAPLEDREVMLLVFALKAIKTPEKVTKEDIDSLHELGWKDSDLLDVVIHGTNMIALRTVTNAFKMDQSME